MPITQSQVDAGIAELERRRAERELQKQAAQVPTSAVESAGPLETIDAAGRQVLSSAYEKAVKPAARTGLTLLQQFERPQEAVQAGALAAAQGRWRDIPSDAWEGSKLQSRTSWGDVFKENIDKIDPVLLLGKQLEQYGWKENRPWEAYRVIRNLAADLLVDPMLGIGKLSKLGKTRQIMGQVGDRVAASEIGKILGIKPSAVNFSEFNQAASNLASKAGYDQKLASEAYNQARQAHIDELVNKGRGSPEQAEEFLKSQQFGQALERPGSTEAKALTEEVQKLDTLRRQNTELHVLNNAKAVELGMPIRGEIFEEGHRFLPRIEDPIAAAEQGVRAGELGKMAKEAAQGRHRELFKWVDPNTGIPVHMGTAKGEPRLRQSIGGRWFFTPVDIPKGQTKKLVKSEKMIGRSRVVPAEVEVVKKQLSRAEIERAGLTKREFIKDPYVSLQLDTMRKIREGHYLDFLIEGKNKGWLKTLDEGAEAPAGWIRLEKSPGMENVAVPAPLVGRLEQMGGLLYNPEMVLGKIGQIVEGLFNGRIGSVGWYMKKGSQSWARNQLAPFMGFHTNNAISNTMLAYIGGGIPGPKLAKRFWEAGKLQTAGKLGKESAPIFPGYTNAEIYTEAARRGAADTSWSRTMMGDETANQVSPTAIQLLFREKNPALAKGEVYEPGRIREGIETAKAGVRGFAERGGRVNQWLFDKVGQNIEDNAKLAVFVNELKKIVPKGTKPTGKHLDEAAYKAKEALFDYGDLPSVFRTLKTALPFVAWSYHISKRTLKDIVHHPERLARLDEMTNFLMKPIPEDKQKYTPEWMKEQAGFTGFQLGDEHPIWDFGQSKNFMPNVALSGRAVPYSTVNEFITRPAQALAGMVLPGLKAPIEMAFNTEFWKNRPIDMGAEALREDERSLPFLQATLGPFTGADYSSRQELFGFNRPDTWEYLLNAYTPFGRYARTLDTIAETVGALTGNEFLRDPSRDPLTLAGLGANTATGGKFYPLDVEKNRRAKQYQQRKKIGSLKYRIKQAINKGRDKKEIARLRRLLNEAIKERDEL